MRRALRLLLPLAVAVSMVAVAQTMIPTGPYQVPVNSWTSAHGAIFDGGLTMGAAGSLSADTLGENECQARFASAGYDNARSPVVLVLDDTSKTRVIGLMLEWVAMDGGVLADGGSSPEISFNQTPLTYSHWWRPYAGGSDAGLPWFVAANTLSVTGTGGQTSRAMIRISNTGAFAIPVGFNCFVPIASGAGVAKVYQRINVVRVPFANPR